MRITVDLDECLGYANCVIEAPEVFDIDDNGKAVVLVEDIDTMHEEAVRTAARMCPVLAITVHDEN